MSGSNSHVGRHELTRTSISSSMISMSVHKIPFLPMILSMILVVFAVPSHGFLAFQGVASSLASSSSTAVASAVAASATTPFLSEEDCVQDQLGYLPPNYVGVSAWKKRTEHSHHRRGVRIAANSTTAGEETVWIPVAIQTYPLNGGAKRRQNKAKLSPVHDRDAATTDASTTKPATASQSIVQSPFPTLFWLTCPDISKAVANLERRGFVQIFETAVNSDPQLSQRLYACHEEYAKLRWQSLTPHDRDILQGNTTVSSLSPSLERMRNMMESSGISGTNFTDIASWDSDYAKGGRDAAASAVPKVPPLKCLHAHYAHYRSTAEVESESESISTRPTINPVGELIHQQLQLDFPDLDL